MPAKETKDAGHATLEEPTPAPQTAADIAATEQATGLAKTEPAPVRMGMAPRNLEEGWRLAKFAAETELVPKGYRKRPADIIIAFQYSMELGLPPMSGLHSIYITNGRPNVYGDGLLAVVMKSPHYKDHEEYYLVGGERRKDLTTADLTKDDTTAVCIFWRTDNPRPREATFSIAKAKTANLWKKAGPWSDYPDRMLKMRARSFAAHDCFPDVLRGIGTEGPGEPAIDVEPEPPKEVHRKSEPVTYAMGRDPQEAAREHAEKLAETATVTPVASEPAQVQLGPCHVLDVQHVAPFMTTETPYYAVTLDHDCGEVRTTVVEEAVELEKFKGSDHQVRLVCEVHADQSRYVLMFALAE